MSNKKVRLTKEMKLAPTKLKMTKEMKLKPNKPTKTKRSKSSGPNVEY